MAKKISKKARLLIYGILVFVLGGVTGWFDMPKSSHLTQVPRAQADVPGVPTGDGPDPCPAPDGCCE